MNKRQASLNQGHRGRAHNHRCWSCGGRLRSRIDRQSGIHAACEQHIIANDQRHLTIEEATSLGILDEEDEM